MHMAHMKQFNFPQMLDVLQESYRNNFMVPGTLLVPFSKRCWYCINAQSAVITGFTAEKEAVVINNAADNYEGLRLA